MPRCCTRSINWRSENNLNVLACRMFNSGERFHYNTSECIEKATEKEVKQNQQQQKMKEKQKWVWFALRNIMQLFEMYMNTLHIIQIKVNLMAIHQNVGCYQTQMVLFCSLFIWMALWEEEEVAVSFGTRLIALHYVFLFYNCFILVWNLLNAQFYCCCCSKPIKSHGLSKLS